MDKATYRRMKKITLKDSRNVEAMEMAQRKSRDQNIRQLQQNKLNSIIDHGTSLIAHHKNVGHLLNKLGKAVIQHHHHIEKEEQRKLERIAKERIQALKNDDEEAYMKLIDEAKDTRLTHLLKQTGEFLETLTKSVVDQQYESKHVHAKHSALGFDTEEEEVHNLLLNRHTWNRFLIIRIGNRRKRSCFCRLFFNYSSCSRRSVSTRYISRWNIKRLSSQRLTMDGLTLQ